MTATKTRAGAGPGPRPPRTQRGRDKHVRLRHVASEMFLTYGYDGVSIDDIVATAGGSKTNVYSQFGGKEQLFATVIGDLCDEFVAALASVDVSHAALGAGLRAIALKLIDVLLRERHLAFHRLVIAESKRVPAVARIRLEHGPEASCRLISGFIARQQQLGRLRAVDPLVAATQFHDMVSFTLVHRALIGDMPTAREIKAVIDAAVDVFLHGYSVAR